MQLPVDFFLRLIHKLMEDLEFNDICKKISKHFETEEEDFVIFKNYINILL